jgi:hypothetical protein
VRLTNATEDEKKDIDEAIEEKGQVLTTSFEGNK